jgi:cell cycle sensor histidine kinase DivJ
MFIGSRFAVSLGGLALAPLCFVAGNVPHWWEAGALGWLVVPFAAAIVVSRSGNLGAGEALNLLTWIGLASMLAAGTGSGIGLGLLVLVPLEAALAGPSIWASLAMGAACGIALVYTVLTGVSGHSLASAHLGAFGAGVIGAATLYGAGLARLAGRLQHLRAAQEALSQERYRIMCDAIDDVVLRFDRSGMVLDASPAAERSFGVKPRDLLGRGLFERIHVADRPAFLKLVLDAASLTGERSSDLRLRTGATVPSQMGAFTEPVFAWAELRLRGLAEDGLPPAAAVTGVLRDVTARKSHQKASEDAARALERSNAGRDLFLANVSHELRTPLNAIIGFAEMLASEQLAPRDPAKQREYAGIIHHSGLHLLAVVNTILDASKIQAGSFDIFPEAFDLAGLVHICCDMVGLKAEQGGIALIRDIAPNLDEVIGDKRACKQILLNLLSNALKFTPPRGKVTIGARPDGNCVVIFVSDSGIGIGARDLPKLGSPFFQAHAAYDRSYDGTGLGLSVVRGLVGLHGGSIAIESAPGQGTRVSVRLPNDCRRAQGGRNPLTKIETIPRYLAAVPSGDVTDLAKVHKIA